MKYGAKGASKGTGMKPGPRPGRTHQACGKSGK